MFIAREKEEDGDRQVWLKTTAISIQKPPYCCFLVSRSHFGCAALSNIFMVFCFGFSLIFCVCLFVENIFLFDVLVLIHFFRC